ncbi:hypothetical protein GQ602_000140 [Ophiocordyceps camponoti-floridani]|uniref:Uncharacterized protein n=1 Tax=Ophiocordyceps camponoti-floridani TaxID=2030778 RepID=A0A8H4QBP6_9HYPO|nr:hypothetical protein GQ602_000140 [Ophiocordyceps camponoti-floridani]
MLGLDGRDDRGVVDGAVYNGHAPPPADDDGIGLKDLKDSSVALGPSAAIRTVDAPLSLPRPQDIHRGWEASSVSTSKCDLCHKQSCGTIQKCSQCKLSVCQICAREDRLRVDERHHLDADAVDWQRPTPAKRSKPRSGCYRARIRKKQASTSGQRRRLPQGRGSARSAARSKPPSSRETSTESPVVVDVDTPSASSAGSGSLDDRLEAAAASRTAETEEIAEILAGMQKRAPSYPHNDGLLLPPVRSLLDVHQAGHHPRLRALHPPLSVSPTPTYDNSAPRPALITYADSYYAPGSGHETYGSYPSEYASWDQHQASSYTFSPPTVAVDQHGHGISVGFAWQSHAACQTANPHPYWSDWHRHHANDPSQGYEPIVNHVPSSHPYWPASLPHDRTDGSLPIPQQSHSYPGPPSGDQQATDPNASACTVQSIMPDPWIATPATQSSQPGGPPTWPLSPRRVA